MNTLKNRFPASAIGTAILLLCGAAAAQNAAPTPAATSSLKEVTVTGNPLGADELIAPAQSYSGTGLLLRSQTTLGETLDGTPGVSSTYFGPNASRPVIRGLDGDRIRILGNGGGMLDASGLSYDHAVSADPISIERIEVLRGPGTLLYGGSAVGGAVNVIDNRIAREPLFDAKGGVSGKVDMGAATGNGEKGGGFLLETGTDRFQLHADVFSRSTEDVRVPIALACARGGVNTVSNRICNSASDVRGGGLGGTLFFDRGYLGASVDTYRNTYGTVAEDNSTIRMRSNRYAIEGELRGLGGFFQSVKGQFHHTDYQHTEFDGADPQTTFKNKGSELRLEARQAKLGNLEGVIGLQADNTRFSADGEEAFAPYSRTRQTALFAYEELGTGWGKLSFGTRVEKVRVASEGNPLVDRFAIGTRDFTPVSYAFGALANLRAGWQATANLAYTERAPKDYELYANGPHGATGTYEVGNPDFDKERSLNVDAGLKWKRGAHAFGVSAFVNTFRNYISLEATGNTRENGEESLPEYAYRQVRARFTGVEANGNVRLAGSSEALFGAAGSTLDLELRGDLVRATNRDTGEALPRIAPARLGATLVWAQGPGRGWGARVGFNHAMAQDRVPAGQLVTGGYTLWNAALTYRMKAQGANLTWYARLDNAGDTLAYSASSILTQTVPGRAPLPGRSLRLGLQATF